MSGGDLAEFLLARFYQANPERWLGIDNERAAFERADIDAKRQIVELHELDVKKDPVVFDQYSGEQIGPAFEVTCAVCGWASDDPTSACETLRLLALPYKDHPEYREEWRP